MSPNPLLALEFAICGGGLQYALFLASQDALSGNFVRLFYTVLIVVLSRTTLASQDTQTPKVGAKSLTNADVLDMLSAGLSQEIVIAKIAASTCEFDTSPGVNVMSSTLPDVEGFS